MFIAFSKQANNVPAKPPCIPNYPSDIATVNFDVTGTTKIGKWYFNHSFMAPGLVGVTTACLIGYGLASVII